MSKQTELTLEPHWNPTQPSLLLCGVRVLTLLVSGSFIILGSVLQQTEENDPEVTVTENPETKLRAEDPGPSDQAPCSANKEALTQRRVEVSPACPPQINSDQSDLRSSPTHQE